MKALLAFIGLTIALSPAPGWAQLCCVVSGKVVGEGSGYLCAAQKLRRASQPTGKRRQFPSAAEKVERSR
jgi:hypothetical protein